MMPPITDPGVAEGVAPPPNPTLPRGSGRGERRTREGERREEKGREEKGEKRRGEKRREGGRR
jgi:hypothetical protein